MQISDCSMTSFRGDWFALIPSGPVPVLFGPRAFARLRNVKRHRVSLGAGPELDIGNMLSTSERP